jgi:arsenate reductase
VITMGCGESCPVVAGHEREDWPVVDPKGRPHDEVKAISAEIRARVVDLLARRGWAR